jgi:hypothetical protein
MARKTPTDSTKSPPPPDSGLTRKKTADANVMEYSAPQPPAPLSSSNHARAAHLNHYRRDDAGTIGTTNQGPKQ